MPNEDQQYDSLPPAIIDALRDLDGPAVLPDAKRDADVLSGARQHLADTAQVERKRRNLRLFFAGGAGSAIAAVILVAFVVLYGANKSEPMAEQDTFASVEPNSPQLTDAQPGDLDTNGSIDILDAYALARQIQQGKPSNANDFNNDGRVDQFDIDQLANQAVRLHTGERG